MLKDLQSLSSRCLSIGVDYHILYVTAASIWFEIWGSWIQVNKILIFPGKFQRNFNFFRQFHKQFQFFQANFFQAKIAYLQLLLGKLFYFSSKVATFEQTSCTKMYIIRYNNISQPVHDPLRLPRPPAQNLGVANPNLQD